MHAKVHKIPTDPPFMDTGAQVAQWVRSLDLTTHTSLSPIRSRFAPGFVNYKKGCTRLAAASDNVYLSIQVTSQTKVKINIIKIIFE
jgi:hypothetical protein